MNFDFLKDFSKRMKKVGTYTLITYNSIYKGTWKSYGFEETYEYMNLLFAVMMFIMEQSLKDEVCTIDDIASFIEDVDSRFFKKGLTFESSKSLGDFIVNTVLCDDGRAMYFKGYDFEEKQYRDIHISFVGNRIIYLNDTVRRTSYYLTEDGYTMMLGTLEVENNMKLTIQEIIFNLHLEKADYNKAVDDIKQIFNLSRIQLQKIEESIKSIRQNVLNFSSEEYESILNDNMVIIQEQRNKFKAYRQHVKEKIAEFYDDGIDIDKLDGEKREKLDNLGIINQYLSKVIGEQQKILNTHFDFKHAYSEALTGMTAMAAIKRINFNNELYEPVLSDPSKIDALDRIFRPLFISKLPKYYNINKCVQYQRSIKTAEEDGDEEIAFDADYLKEEKERELRLKLLKYKNVLEVVLDHLIFSEKGIVTLRDIISSIRADSEDREKLVPSVEIFREVMIELLKANHIDIAELKREANNSVDEDRLMGFELNKMVMALIEENRKYEKIKFLEINKVFDGEPVKIIGAQSDKGWVKTVTCSNIEFRRI